MLLVKDGKPLAAASEAVCTGEWFAAKKWCCCAKVNELQHCDVLFRKTPCGWLELWRVAVCSVQGLKNCSLVCNLYMLAVFVCVFSSWIGASWKAQHLWGVGGTWIRSGTEISRSVLLEVQNWCSGVLVVALYVNEKWSTVPGFVRSVYMNLISCSAWFCGCRLRSFALKGIIQGTAHM